MECVAFKKTKRSNSSKTIEPYKWSDYAEDHTKQRQHTLNYIKENLTLPKKIVVIDVAKNKELLSLENHSLFP